MSDQDLNEIAEKLKQVAFDLSILRANDKSRDERIRIQADRIGELLKSNNALLERCRAAEAKLKER